MLNHTEDRLHEHFILPVLIGLRGRTLLLQAVWLFDDSSFYFVV